MRLVLGFSGLVINAIINVFMHCLGPKYSIIYFQYLQNKYVQNVSSRRQIN